MRQIRATGGLAHRSEPGLHMVGQRLPMAT